MGDQVEEDPTVFHSRVKGTDLCDTMNQMDTFEKDIIHGYTVPNGKGKTGIKNDL
jgi:hypothetical protein